MLLDSVGNIAATYDYDAFGNILRSTINTTITTQNSFGFHSEHKDSATALVYLRARWYAPSEGRFVGMDKYEGNPNNPLTLNKYISFGNNPINKMDTSGCFYSAMNVMTLFEVNGILASYPTIHTLDERGKILDRIIMRRIHINIKDDEWGHWWVEIGRKPNIEESYGWWPKGFVSGLGELVLGVEGELNGITHHGGEPTHDPHEGEVGDENFSPRLKKNSKYRNTEQVVQRIRDFASAYSGKWSYPLGKNCHSFQIEMMKKVDLEKPLGGY